MVRQDKHSDNATTSASSNTFTTTTTTGSRTVEEGERGRPCRAGPNDVLGGLSAHSYHPLQYRQCGQACLLCPSLLVSRPFIMVPFSQVCLASTEGPPRIRHRLLTIGTPAGWVSVVTESSIGQIQP